MHQRHDRAIAGQRWSQIALMLSQVALLVVLGMFLIAEHRVHTALFRPGLLVAGLALLCLVTHWLLHRGLGEQREPRAGRGPDDAR